MTTEAIDDAAGRAARPRHRVVGTYRLLQPLGEGGMGVVHLAVDRQGKAVAMKLLRRHLHTDPDARARLGREVDALRRVRSAHVAPVIDADLVGPTPYVVTRYIPGESLDDHVEGTGPLTGAALHTVASGLAEAIDAIHSAGVVHRDVKPGNVLLAEGEPVLIDFGIAHLVDDVRLTQTGLVMGTPGYLAPEIIEGAEVTPATDWWGWAATLAYAACGRPPFGRGAMDAVLARVARGEPDLRGVDPRLAPLLYAALSPRAHERPHQREVVAALQRYAAGGAVTEAVELRRVAPATSAVAIPRTAALPQPAPVVPPPPPAWASPSQPAAVAQPSSTRPAPAMPAPSMPARSVPAPAMPATARPRPVTITPVPTARPAPALPQPVTPAQPAALPPPAHAADPRIGRPVRTGTLAAYLTLLVSAGAVFPALTLTGVFVWLVAARTADRSVTSLILRRHERGRRGSDVPVAIASSPWHALLALLSAVFTVLIPLLVAASAALCTAVIVVAVRGGQTQLNAFLPLAVGTLFGIVLLWWGPGGASTRRGTRSLVRGLHPHPATVAVVILVLVAAAGIVGWGLLRGTPLWWPAADPATWGWVPTLP